jgi:hypothetical protein
MISKLYEYSLLCLFRVSSVHQKEFIFCLTHISCPQSLRRLSVGLSFSGDLLRDPSPDMSREIVVTNSPPPPAHFPGMYINKAKILNTILLGTCPCGSRGHWKREFPQGLMMHRHSFFFFKIWKIYLYVYYC